jgi:hypothetical protein
MLGPEANAAKSDGDVVVDVGRAFLRLTNLPSFALDRLSRYEVTLWRQVDQILLALDNLDRRKPQERRRHPLSRAASGGSESS